MGDFDIPNGPFSDVTLYMGRGDDARIGAGSSGGSLVSGGTGDDVIEMNRSATPTAGDTIFGGDGDDIISAATSFNGGAVDPLVIYGGEGADTINIGIESVDVPAVGNGGAGEVRLMDFDPAEDSLTVVISTEAQLRYSSSTVVNHPAEGYSELRMSFRDPGGNIFQSSIQFDGITDLQSNDINLRLQQG